MYQHGSRGTRTLHAGARRAAALVAVAAATGCAAVPATATADLFGIPLPGPLGGSTSAPPAPADPLAYNQALHLTPPLGPGAGSAATADTALNGQLTVDICKLARGQCAAVTRLLPQASPADKLYHATWQSSQAGAKSGDVFKFVFRAASLNIGSALLRAGNVLTSQQVGNFTAGLPVRISFSVDRVPVIRTRSLHDLGATSVDVGQMLHNEFNLGDSDALTAVYRDVRAEDVLQAPAIHTEQASPGPLVLPFSLGQVADSVASLTSYGDVPQRIAQILKARTPLGNQSIVNSLVSSNVLQGVLSPGGLLGIIQGTLGVADRIPALTLLKDAQRDDGSPAFDAPGVLRAIVEITNGPTSAVAALQELADVGFPADTSMQAIKQVDASQRAAGLPGLLPTDAGQAIATLAAAGLQTTEFNGADIAGGLASVFGGGASDYDVPILTAARGLVDANCADYTKPVEVGSVADLLRSKTDVVGAADVAKQLETGGCGFDVTRAAGALHYVYFAAIPKPVDEMVAIGQNLIKALPSTPVTDLLLGLTSTAKNKLDQPQDALSCLAAVGTVSGAAAAGVGGFGLANVLGQLDSPQLSGLIVNPFGTGVGGPLDQLGRCLVANGIVPPMPLDRITVDFTGASIPAAIPQTNIGGELLVARAGWAPNLAAAVPGRLGNLLSALKVPSAGPLGALTSKIASLTTLPVAVAGGPNVRLSDALTCGGAGPGNTLFSRADYIHQYPFGGNDGCPPRGHLQDPVIPNVRAAGLLVSLGSDQPGVFTDGTVNGLPAAPISFAEGLASGLTHNGRATFVVPALPGTVTIQGTLFGDNNLNCLSASPNPALYAAAIALPSDIYSALANGAGTDDIWATTGDSKNIDGTANTLQSIGFKTNFQTNPGKCALRSIRNGWIVGDDEADWDRNTPGGDTGLEGTITISRVGVASTASEAQAIVGNLAGKVTVRNADPGDGSGDLGFTPKSGGTLAGVNGMLPGDLDGNFLSLLGAVGGQALTGDQIVSLLGAPAAGL